LLDEKLRAAGLDRNLIEGYDREETSHLAVASCVARGEADVGIGTEKAALQVANIDFVPMQQERYDLVIRREDAGKPAFQAMLAILRSPDFQNELAGMGGYGLAQLGQIIAEV
jgi:putative molybdopterin biosynthesis protein